MWPRWLNSILNAVREPHAHDALGVKHRPSSRTAILVKIGFLGLVASATWVPESVHAQSFCDSCEVQVGLGATYHYWATTGSLVLPVTVNWSENRYEFGIFRFTDTQLLPLPGTRRERPMANPYWGASLSRRWQIFERGPVRGFVGFGLAGRTESDELSATRWDFASQLGVRFRLPGSRVIAEVTMRHWSNAGIRLPNHGQDFATVTVRLNPRLFGFREAQEIPIDPSLGLNRTLAENSLPSDEALP